MNTHTHTRAHNDKLNENSTKYTLTPQQQWILKWVCARIFSIEWFYKRVCAGCWLLCWWVNRMRRRRHWRPTKHIRVVSTFVNVTNINVSGCKQCKVQAQRQTHSHIYMYASYYDNNINKIKNEKRAKLNECVCFTVTAALCCLAFSVLSILLLCASTGCTCRLHKYVAYIQALRLFAYSHTSKRLRAARH